MDNVISFLVLPISVSSELLFINILISFERLEYVVDIIDNGVIL